MKRNLLVLTLLLGVSLFTSLETNAYSQDFGGENQFLNSEYLTINDLVWNVGAFDCYNSTLTFISMDGFDYDIIDEIHFKEVGAGTYYPWNVSYVAVGAYATIPVKDGNVYFTFEGRAKAGHIDAVDFNIRVYDNNMTWLMSSASDPANIPSISQIGALDSGLISMESNLSVDAYDEVTVFFCYNDYFATNWEQEFWIYDLKVYPSEPPLPPERNYLAVEDLTWTTGAFDTFEQSLYFISMDGFTYSITDQIHFLETGAGTYYPLNVSYVAVGAYATVPVINDKLYFTFKGRARADHLDAVLLGIRIYDTNMTWLMSSTSDPDKLGSITQPGVDDSGYIYFENNVTLTGLDEAVIFFAYNDYFAANWNQEFIISDLRVYVDDDTPTPTPTPTPTESNNTIIPLPLFPVVMAVLTLAFIFVKKRKFD